jgi:small RNA 2'-O-methyltransferase
MHEQRVEAVLDEIRAVRASSVLDLGCGDGVMLLRLVREPGIERLFGVDVSSEALDALRPRLAELPEEVRSKIAVAQGSMTDWNEAYLGFDAAILVETIEHVAPERLSALEASIFARARPRIVIVTTPNRDFNALLGVPPHRLRRHDHAFEWGRAKFRDWAQGVAGRNGYEVAFRDIAGAHPDLGGASQLARFRRDP